MINIRKATLDDVPQIIEIWKDFMDYHRPMDSFWTRTKDAHKKVTSYIRSNLSNKDYLIIVAEDGKRLIGYQIAQVMEHPPILERVRHCLINDIAIIEPYRRKGIGRKMFNEARMWSRENNIDRIELQVVANNNKAIKFYEKLGLKSYLIRMYLDFD